MRASSTKVLFTPRQHASASIASGGPEFSRSQGVLGPARCCLRHSDGLAFQAPARRQHLHSLLNTFSHYRRPSSLFPQVVAIPDLPDSAPGLRFTFDVTLNTLIPTLPSVASALVNNHKLRGARIVSHHLTKSARSARSTPTSIVKARNRRALSAMATAQPDSDSEVQVRTTGQQSPLAAQRARDQGDAAARGRGRFPLTYKEGLSQWVSGIDPSSESRQETDG